MSIHLWLVRHGATDWSDAGRFLGWADVHLNRRGRRQANALRQRLPREPFASVWSSDLVRSTETAQLAVGGAASDWRLRELDFGDLEGMRWDDCSPVMQAELFSFDHFRAPGGESVDELRRRVLDFARGLPSGEHLVFSHGGVIRLLLRESGRDGKVVPGALEQVVL